MAAVWAELRKVVQADRKRRASELNILWVQTQHLAAEQHRIGREHRSLEYALRERIRCQEAAWATELSALHADLRACRQVSPSTRDKAEERTSLEPCIRAHCQRISGATVDDTKHDDLGGETSGLLEGNRDGPVVEKAVACEGAIGCMDTSKLGVHKWQSLPEIGLLTGHDEPYALIADEAKFVVTKMQFPEPSSEALSDDSDNLANSGLGRSQFVTHQPSHSIDGRTEEDTSLSALSAPLLAAPPAKGELDGFGLLVKQPLDSMVLDSISVADHLLVPAAPRIQTVATQSFVPDRGPELAQRLLALRDALGRLPQGSLSSMQPSQR